MSPLERAERFMELGIFLDAWNSLKELPPEQRATPQVFAFRVKILAPLKKMEDAPFSRKCGEGEKSEWRGGGNG